MSTVLVTGGDGFIGSHLVDALCGEGHAVRIIDNLVANGGKYLNSKAQHFKLSIFTDPIADAFKGVEYVFHCAALPRIQPSIDEPKEFHDINVTGTLNVLIASRNAKVKRFIYSASSSAYGDQETLPLVETMPTRPKSPYAVQKLMGEMYCSLFSQLYGMETVSLRYFNVYGSRQASTGAYATVIGIFLEQLRQGKPLTIVPDGKQTRDFTHVSDVVKANIKAMQSASVGKGDVINVGTGTEYSIFDVARMIGGTTEFCAPRTGEAQATRADSTKAKKLLDWQPAVSLEQGIGALKGGVL